MSHYTDPIDPSWDGVAPEVTKAKMFHLPLWLCLKLKKLAKEKGRTQTHIITEALDLYLSSQTGPVPEEEMRKPLPGYPR